MSEDTLSLGHVALACQIHLQELLKDEESQEDAAKAREGFWASRQSAEFNLWCTKAGVYGEGLRAIDVRLKDVPGIFELLKQLLQSLLHDFAELQQPDKEPEHAVNNHDGSDEDVQSDSSSLSFMSLSSSEKSEAKADGAIDDLLSASEERHAALRTHIADTIDRLHGHALQIDRAGAKHRRERIEVYRQKESPKWAYEGYKELAIRAAKGYFPSASETFRQRIGESFARRRIRFEYLAEHQKKRAVEVTVHQSQSSPAKVLSGSKDHDRPMHIVKIQEADAEADVFSQRLPHDQHTIYSATVNTKLDMQPQPNRQERAESVASVALRHPGFPPPPKLYGDGFQCPYCRLEFRANEAGKERWSQHVIQDFEPYFCTLEDCKAPFDVPNSFDGLLEHLQSHLQERYHIDMPDGKHEEFDETEFEHHLAQHGEISTEMESIMKKASRRKGPYLFESCPFCGGYPDVIEKLFSDSDTLEAQKALRKHIKQHMQDIALFLPPYREDILDEDDDLKSFAVTGQSANVEDFEGLGEFPEICGQKDCDCKSRGRSITETLPDVSIAVTAEGMETQMDLITPILLGDTDPDLWKEMFPTSAAYDSSPVPDEYFLGDEHLRSFLVSLSSRSHDIPPSISKVAEALSTFNPIEDSQAFQDCMSSLAVPEISKESRRFYPIAENRCEWVFQHKEYLDWVAGRHMLLWIRGRPGSGKSTLLNRLLANLRKNTSSGASDIVLSFSFRNYISFFFGNYSDELQNARRSLYQSLLFQILGQAPDALPELIRTFEQRRKQSRETGESWRWDPDVLRLFFVIAVSRICQCDRIWLFIDSLEVCSQDIIANLTEELEALIPPSSDSSKKAHICLTCHGQMHLDPNRSLQIYPENENQGDMTLYMLDQISEDTLRATNILPIIVEKASGIFTLAILLVEKVLELERKQVSARIIEQEIESISPVIELYHKLIARRGSLSWSLETIYTIDEAIVQLLIDEDAEIWFLQTLSQTPLSWAMERGYEVAANLLLDRGAEMEFGLSPHATPMTPSTAVVAQDGIQPPPAQIHSVPRDASDDLRTADASSSNTDHHFVQESTLQQLESSNIRSSSIIAELREASDHIDVQDKMREQTPNKNRSMEGDAVKECFLCKTSFAPFQARHRCRACGLFFDSKCTAVMSTPDGQRKQDQKEDGANMAKEILGPLLTSVPTVQFLLPQAYKMSRREWEAVKSILEKNLRARDDLSYLADLLERGETGSGDGNEAEINTYSGSLRVCKSCLPIFDDNQPPVLPAFLSLSEQDIKDRFQELGRANRAQRAKDIQDLGEARWAVYTQPDGHTNMDRYDDIRPFAQNRVKLQVPENTSDYVNASPIILTSPSHPSQPPLRYIAMKEPTRASIDHVWRMVAEQTSSPAVIVQISTMVEVTMSTLYFPENEEPWNLNKSNLWGDDWKAKLSVISSEIDNGGTEKSKLLLHVHGEEEPRVVWHYLYTRWDTYSPYSLDHLGGLVEVMKSSWQHNSPSNPRIIHCDDGSGRTSVFIALDHLIRELNFGALASYNLPQEGDDPVYNTVEILYQQRQNMVHRQAHYLLLYEAMKKLWHDKYGVVAEEGSGESAAWRREESSPREQCIDGA